MNSFNIKVEEMLENNNFVSEDYFSSLRKDMTLENFIQNQKQFYYAVTKFVSHLAMVAAAIPTYQDRVNIIKNLWEEHGEGDLSQTHGATFTELLRRLEKKTDVVIPAAGMAVTEFNNTLEKISKDSSYMVSVAMIGMIEHMFADISAYIGEAIVERGWLSNDQVIHYALHQELDCIHAEDFFSIVRKHYSDKESQELIDQGLVIGQKTFLNLYQGLYEL